MPFVHLHQHFMPLEGPSRSDFIPASMPSSGLILSSHKQDLWKENDISSYALLQWVSMEANVVLSPDA